MKKILILIIIFINQSIQLSSSEKKIEILFKVNENIISNVDIINEAKYLKVLNKGLQGLSVEEILKFAKNSLLKEMIKKDEIEKFYNIDYSSKEVDVYIERLYKGLGFNNLSEFKEYLSQNNIEIKELRKKLIIEKSWNSLIYEIYNKKIVINKNEILNNLDEVIKKNSIQNSYKLSEIVFSEKNKDEYKKKYNDIINDINNLGFSEAAIIHSISDTSRLGGDIGWINQAQMSKKIFEQIKNLKTGEYSDPIVTAGGSVIFKINEIKEVINDQIDKDLELSNMIKSERNRQLKEYSIIHYKKIENISYVKQI